MSSRHFWAWIICVVLAGGVLLRNHGAANVDPNITPRDAQPLPHEGQAVNGLRLEFQATFVPEEDGDGSATLHMKYIFHNETDSPILLDGYGHYYSLVFSRHTPIDAAGEVGREQMPIGCGGITPGREHIWRVPAHGRYEFSNWTWCSGLEIPDGRTTEDCHVIDDPEHYEYFKLTKAGRVALAVVYRADGEIVTKEMSTLLTPGEEFWSGRVYSNVVVVNFAPLHQKRPVPDNYTGEWIDRYPSGKPERIAHYKEGRLDGLQVTYYPSGKKHWEVSHKLGVEHGLYLVYDFEGRKEFQQTRRDGRCTGPMIWWYPNGTKKAEEDLVDGIAHGRYTAWHESGKKKEEGENCHGRKCGTWTQWDEAGNVSGTQKY